MKNPLIFIISFFTVNLLTADLIDEAKTKIRSGDFVEASSYISDYLIGNPGDSRAYTYKCFSDIGIFFEDTLPNYLIDNFNASSTKTLESFDYDESKQGIEPTEIQLLSSDGMDSVIGYWGYYPEVKFPIRGDPQDSLSYRYASIFDLSIEPENKSVFNFNNGYYYPTDDNSAISFTYIFVNPSQVNFETNSMSGSGNMKIYINGSEVGEIYNDSYTLYRNVRSDNTEYGSQISGYGTIPLYLHYGDIVSFVSEPNYMGESSYVPGIRPLNPYSYSPPELGIAYSISYPNLGNGVTIDDILDLLRRKDLPVRELVGKLINNLENFNIGDEVVIDSQFYTPENTETVIDPLDPLFEDMNDANTYDDIIIQHWDALALKSILGIIELTLGLSDQYDIGINYSYEELSGMDIYKSAKSFFSSFSSFLEANPSRITDQVSAATNLESSLLDLKDSLNTIWNRADPVANDADFLIERSGYSAPGELADLNVSIDSLIQSIDGFDKSSNLTGKSDGGFKYCLNPIVGQSPFALKQAIIDSEDSLDASGEMSSSRQIKLMKQYGIVSDLLPASFEGNILAIYNSNGSLHKTISVSSDDFDPFSGELGRLNDNGMGGDYIFDMYDDITLSHEELFKGTWQNESNMSGATTNGTFYYYNDLLDMNNNGVIDRIELDETDGDPASDGYSLSYPVNLSATSISDAQSLFDIFQPSELKGNILIYRVPNLYDEYYTKYAFSYVSNNDAIAAVYDYQNFYTSLSYNYENGIKYLEPQLNQPQNGVTYSFIFNDNHSGVALSSTAQSPTEMFDFIIYPAYIDLDNDGIADGEEIKMEIIPDVYVGGNNTLPSSLEIQSAIAEYTPPSDGNDNDGTGSNPTNALALTDNDNDNMPDALENKFGGNPNDGTDASSTLNVLINNVYTSDQIRDLRPGSTMIEVVDGYAQLGLTLQESYDLNNWVNVSVPIAIDPIQADSGTAFYRFKLD